MKPLYLTMFVVVGLVSTVFSQVPAQFTVNNLGTPEFNGTYVAQDPNSAYPVYVNQTNPEYVLFSSGGPPHLAHIIPNYWRFSKFTGYTGTGSMNGLQKDDYYSYSYSVGQPFSDPTQLVFSNAGAGVVPAPGSPQAPFQSGIAGGSVFVEQAIQLNVGLTFEDGQWTPSNN